MQQLLLNITNSRKIDQLLNLLKSLDYVQIEGYNEENLKISEKEKQIILKRVKHSSENDFRNWDEYIESFDV